MCLLLLMSPPPLQVPFCTIFQCRQSGVDCKVKLQPIRNNHLLVLGIKRQRPSWSCELGSQVWIMAHNFCKRTLPHWVTFALSICFLVQLNLFFSVTACVCELQKSRCKDDKKVLRAVPENRQACLVIPGVSQHLGLLLFVPLPKFFAAFQ